MDNLVKKKLLLGVSVNRLLIIIILCLLQSCTSMVFIANGKPSFLISANEKSEQQIEIENHSEFYFWGNSPGTAVINLVNEGHELGLNTPSSVSLEQKIGWKSFFYTVFSFGLYAPVDYKIAVLSAIEKKE